MLEAARQHHGPIRIDGWTDNVPRLEPGGNQALSEYRANAVKDYLASNGVEASRITAHGNGVSDKYDNSNAEGRHQNRRVDVTLLEE